MQYKNLGKYIRKKRLLLGISLNAFALNSDIDPATLSNFETGKSGISFDTFTKIAKGFNLVASELLLQYEKENK